jgi:hypothetical protein
VKNKGDKMQKQKYIYYEEDGFFIGFFEEFPDYRTQGKTLKELIENLKDIYRDLNSGEIPHVYHAGELELVP